MFPLLTTTHSASQNLLTEDRVCPSLHGLNYDDAVWGYDSILQQLKQLLIAQQSSMVSLKTMRSMLDAIDDWMLRYIFRGDIGESDAGRCSRALIMAGHVFLYVTLRQVPPRSPPLRRMCERLRSALEFDIADGFLWTHDSAALLWMSFIGLLGSGGLTDATAEGKWFMGLFQTVAKNNQQERSSGSSTLGESLCPFPWCKNYCQPLLDRLERGFHLVHPLS
jgi:hypothetical protein